LFYLILSSGLLKPPRLETYEWLPDGRRNNEPVHVLAPGAGLFDVGGAVLVAGDMFSLEKKVSMDGSGGEQVTLVDAKAAMPIVAIIAWASSPTASVSSPSSGSSACAGGCSLTSRVRAASLWWWGSVSLR